MTSTDAPLHVLVVGDALLDADVVGAVHRVAPDAPVPVVDVVERRARPGGAGLAARLLAGRTGDDGLALRVTLVTALADDDGGRRLRALLEQAGVAVRPVVAAAATRTLTRVRGGGQSIVRVDDPAPPLAVDAPVDATALDALLAAADAVLVADYGLGLAAHPAVRAALTAHAGRRPVVWDPHPRGADPVPGVTVATPNRSETLGRTTGHGPAGDDLAVAAGTLREQWQAGAVAATDGGDGVVVVTRGRPPQVVPVPRRVDGDPCGAGDRFAGTLALRLAAGDDLDAALPRAVADTGHWLASGGVATVGAALDPRQDAPRRPVVVATGGCFDVLHAGHVACLEAARALGDRLVVLLNSDDSVRRLKGPGRPANTAADRARVLASLGCVDEVRVFDEDGPERALADLRPDVWAKGGDYTDAMLPEAPLVRSWGGRVVLLPYLPGRSTTRILEHAVTLPDPAPEGAPA